MSEHDMPRRMYADLSWAFPIICPPEDYEKEGEVFSKTISALSRIPIEAVLNLGSGGGNHDFCLRRRFQVTGTFCRARKSTSPTYPKLAPAPTGAHPAPSACRLFSKREVNS